MDEDANPAPVILRAHDQVRILALNRPELLNAIDSAMAEAIQRAITEVAADADCRCLVLAAEGRAFCSGQALPTGGDEELPADIAGLIRERYLPIVTGLQRLPIPVLAAVNGLAVGAGFSLALACDLRVASSSAWFSCGFERIGLVPDSGATYFLPRLLGLSRALELVWLGGRISADEALRLGLVARVYPDSSFESDYLALAAELAQGATRALGQSKRLLLQGWGSTLDEQLELEATLQQASSETEDFREGLRAFKERRPPRFQGR
ncbi:MAG: enoyl-CoA hydratase/isomerase family protein [Candidatus Dormibacteria bacterium]